MDYNNSSSQLSLSSLISEGLENDTQLQEPSKSHHSFIRQLIQKMKKQNFIAIPPSIPQTKNKPGEQHISFSSYQHINTQRKKISIKINVIISIDINFKEKKFTLQFKINICEQIPSNYKFSSFPEIDQFLIKCNLSNFSHICKTHYNEQSLYVKCYSTSFPIRGLEILQFYFDIQKRWNEIKKFILNALLNIMEERITIVNKARKKLTEIQVFYKMDESADSQQKRKANSKSQNYDYPKELLEIVTGQKCINLTKEIAKNFNNMVRDKINGYVRKMEQIENKTEYQKIQHKRSRYEILLDYYNANDVDGIIDQTKNNQTMPNPICRAIKKVSQDKLIKQKESKVSFGIIEFVICKFKYVITISKQSKLPQQNFSQQIVERKLVRKTPLKPLDYVIELQKKIIEFKKKIKQLNDHSLQKQMIKSKKKEMKQEYARYYFSSQSFLNEYLFLTNHRQQKNLLIAQYLLEQVAQNNEKLNRLNQSKRIQISKRSIYIKTYKFNLNQYMQQPKGVFVQGNLKQILSILIQIASMLQYLRKLKILHRDLKPQNIMVDDDLRLKFIDWGSYCSITKNEQDQQKLNSILKAKVDSYSFPTTKHYSQQIKYFMENHKQIFKEEFGGIKQKFQRNPFFDIYNFGRIINQILENKSIKNEANNWIKESLKYLIGKCTDVNPMKRLKPVYILLYLNEIKQVHNRISLKVKENIHTVLNLPHQQERDRFTG